MKAPSTLLTPIIATSLSPSLSKSPQETELLERPKKGSSFWTSEIVLSNNDRVFASLISVTTLVADKLGVTIIVSSPSSTLSSTPVIVKSPVVKPAFIKIEGFNCIFKILWLLPSVIKRSPEFK